MMRGWEQNPHGWGAEQWIVPLLMVAVLVVIVVGIVLVIRSQNARHSPAPTSAPAFLGSVGVNQAALQILEERYARGDIQRDEFMQRRQDLWLPTGPPVSSPPAPPAGPPAAPPAAQ
jgi:putative membrane protein